MFAALVGFTAVTAAAYISTLRGPAPVIDPNAIALTDTASYAQDDPAWANETLGGSGESLAEAGCLISATAMALTNFGYEMNPSELNTKLKRSGGYTREGWLIWSHIPKVTDGKYRALLYNSGSPAFVDRCLAAGQYPLVRYTLFGGIPHWVIVIKKSGGEYYVRDPLQESDAPILFAKAADKMKSVRCIAKADAA